MQKRAARGCPFQIAYFKRLMLLLESAEPDQDRSCLGASALACLPQKSHSWQMHCPWFYVQQRAMCRPFHGMERGDLGQNYLFCRFLAGTIYKAPKPNVLNPSNFQSQQYLPKAYDIGVLCCKTSTRVMTNLDQNPPSHPCRAGAARVDERSNLSPVRRPNHVNRHRNRPPRRQIGPH
jgi:hypothetical protein